MSFSNDGSSGDEAPPRIHVKDVTRGWLLRTDQELAHRLQDEEISKHLSGNRHRNGQIREDFPAAAAAQRKAEEKARRKARLLKRQAEEDAQVARELQALQHLELQRGRSSQTVPADHLSNFPSQRSDVQSTSYPENFGLPRTSKIDTSNNNDIYPENKVNKVRNSSALDEVRNLINVPAAISGPSQQSDEASGFSTKYLEELEAALGVSKEQLHKEQTRLLQEERDAELARLLGSKGKEDPNEIRDGELARLLQNREYERFRKLKEKQKARALQKQLMKNNAAENRALDRHPSLGDTYCQPYDLISENRQSSIDSHPMRLDSFSSTTENQEDPYYTEPFHTKPGFHDQAALSDSLNSFTKDSKSFRPPPAPPKTSGRPKMAEPKLQHDSLDLEDDLRSQWHNDSRDIQQRSSLQQDHYEDDSKKQSSKKRQRSQDGRPKSGCRQQ